MSIRVSLLILFVLALAAYAWRDWFRATCGLIVMMAVMQHPDMPKNIMNIQGLNPWNLLMADILLAWFFARRREGLTWDMPVHVNVLLVLYGVVITVSFVRMVANPDAMADEGIPFTYLISEHWINAIKWVIPGLLLFDGCRTRARLYTAVFSILLLYLGLAIQVIRWMPASAAVSGDAITGRALKIIQNEIGYSRVNMSMLLSGASWATLAVIPLLRRRWQQALAVVCFFLIAYGQALTGGRMGYVAWGVVGFLLCVVRWRRGLLLFPAAAAMIYVAAPGVVERMMQGFGQTTVTGGTYTDDYEVTSGRTLIWPYVVQKIMESPAIGYGQLAMARSGLREYLWSRYRESFPHPHNAYLECLLDNGIIGFSMIMPFYGVVVFHSMRLFLDSRSPVFVAVGGMTLALVLALLVCSMGSQTFYPREGAVGMWAAIGVMLRVSVERRRLMDAMDVPIQVPVRRRGRAESPVGQPATVTHGG